MGSIEELPRVPVSIGELYDKITILEIKEANFQDPEKIEFVRRELGLLRDEAERCAPAAKFEALIARLKSCNQNLWDAENLIRGFDHNDDFGEAFVEVARRIHRVNDERARFKREINAEAGSYLSEQKEYDL